MDYPRASGRSDFVGGIDNEALDFSQLEAFINSEGVGGYFVESLGGKKQGHHLPESPPDSGSEHPYSPAESQPNGLSGPVITIPPLPIPTPLVSHVQTTGHLSPQAHISQTQTLLSPNHLAQTQTIPEIHTNTVPLHIQSLSIPNAIPRETNLNHILAGSATHLSPSHYSTHVPGTATNILASTSSGINLNLPGTQTLYADITKAQILQPQNILINDSIYLANIDPNNRHTLLEIGQNRNYRPNELIEITTADLAATDYSNGVGDIVNNENIVFSSLPPISKKRKLSQDLTQQVKPEPAMSPACASPALEPPGSPERSGTADPGDGSYSDPSFQCIRFQPFMQQSWHVLYNQSRQELPVPHYRVDADKGFNFSNSDEAFVCQKKNHFQITCHAQLQGDAQFVKTAEGLEKISSFHLHFYGVKVESPTQTIKVEQSQSDRSKKPFHPVLCKTCVDLQNEQVMKVTVGRLHFSETTSNNMRKKGKPNPDQRFFQLIVGLHAHTVHGNYPVVSHGSEKIIVRASNPGQFESDIELCWQRGQTQDSIFHAGKVGINTDRPDETLVVHGNLKVSGHIVQPSDVRAKQDINELDTAQQLRNVQKIRVVSYSYQPEFAMHSGLTTLDILDTGVIAQEVQKVIPDAVTKAGDIILPNGQIIDNFLVVNKDRIYMENIGAVKELCKVTDSLETRIDQLERINLRLSKIQLKRKDSMHSNSNSTLTRSLHGNEGYQHSSKKQQKHVPKQCCTEENNEICSNKFIQIVIVVLVLIMASCLAAMSTLYFIEHNRKYQPIFDRLNFQNKLLVSTPNLLVPTEPTFRNVNSKMNYNQFGYPPDISNFLDSIKSSLISHIQNIKPSKLPYTVKSLGHYYDDLQNIGDNKGDSEHLLLNNNLQADDFSGYSVYSRIKTVPTLGKPDHCGHNSEFQDNHCQVFCCSNTHQVFESPEVSEKSEKKLQRHTPPEFIMPNLTEYSIEIINDAKNLIPKHNVTLYSNENLSKVFINNTYKIKQNSNGKKNEGSLRKKRQIDKSVLQDGYIDDLENCEQVFVIISGKNFNQTIGSDLVCFQNPKMLNITYTVPLSKYMMESRLILQFLSKQPKDMYLCKTKELKGLDCIYPEQSNIPVNIQLNGLMFDIELFGYQSKNFTLRAPLSIHSENVCDLQSNRRGEFLEYTINLYRDCQE